ncbi:MAG: metallophosphoesterase [Phycisphaeraceae bacterium]
MTSHDPILSRRALIKSGIGLAAATAFTTASFANDEAKDKSIAYFLVGDTHYLADKMNPAKMDETSSLVCGRLINTLNRLPGSELPETLGGGKVAQPRGVIHAGDLIDTGDKNGGPHPAMQQTEWDAFQSGFGLNGGDGKLRWPVFEVHGNHDSPSGKGITIDGIIARNKTRKGLVNVSDNGLHFAWNWGDLHCVNLGIVVGSDAKIDRRRRYAPLDSLPFLIDDLKKNIGDSGKPVLITHHIDVLRYNKPCDASAPFASQEWDPCDVAAFHAALKGYRIAAIQFGHTHARSIIHWNGTGKADQGISLINTDNAGHFHSRTQAFFYMEVTATHLIAREYRTADAWETGEWNPMSWKLPIVTA